MRLDWHNNLFELFLAKPSSNPNIVGTKPVRVSFKSVGFAMVERDRQNFVKVKKLYTPGMGKL